MTMTHILIAAVSAALLAGAGSGGFAQQSDENAAAAQRQNSTHSIKPAADDNAKHLAIAGPRIFLQNQHRT
jgi:hypothetical protein